MQLSVSCLRTRGPEGQLAGLGILAALSALLALVAGETLVTGWRYAIGAAHGPIILLIGLGLFWIRRRQFGEWRHAAGGGLVLAALSAFLYVTATWADVDFVRIGSVLSLAGGAVWYLGGWPALRSAAAPLGFLLFMIPWPATVTANFAFPLQLLSSAYAAILAGLIGLPVQRDGIHLAVLPYGAEKPVYSVLVGQACSGLTSLTMLVAVAYLVAYHTPIRSAWRVALVAAVVPLALLMNAVRITLILAAGAGGNAALARWVHDNEGPVLVFLCGCALMGMRQALLAWTRPRQQPVPHAPADDSVTTREGPSPERPQPRHYRLGLLNAVLSLALVGGFWGGRVEAASLVPPDHLSRLHLPFRGWSTSDQALSPLEMRMLRPEAVLVRTYRDHKGAEAQLAVVAGHRKETVHTPVFCLARVGWETIARRRHVLQLGARKVTAVRMRVLQEGREMLVTYFFTDGEYSTDALSRFQVVQLMKRLRLQVPLGALVRVIVPVGSDAAAAERTADEFSTATLPRVLDSLRTGGGAVY